MSVRFLQIHAADNVAVALEDAGKGAAGPGATALERIPAGHKMALAGIPEGGLAVKYGFPIGRASRDIPAGGHVHSHNLKTRLEAGGDYTYNPSPPAPTARMDGTFSGYTRSDGTAGIRNEIWIINTVGCVNKISERVAARANRRPAAGQTDGVYAFAHPYGCSQLGGDHENTRKILAGLAKHPNAGGVLVFGLGCENNGLRDFEALLGDYDRERVKFLSAQEHEDEEAEALRLIDGLAAYASRFKRGPVNIGKLVVGLKCGGSDGFSGITANPLAGRVSDTLRAHGGTSVLTETPEMFGAETLLMDRCATPGLFGKTADMINGYKAYFSRHGQAVYENPSPGNKEGGITTLEEKSLGCVQKGGRGPVTDVLEYGGRAGVPGLTLLDGPGNDPVSVTALAAAGAHVILFTTGRGTPYGGPVPTVKIASNSSLAKKKARWTDFDAGALLNGGSPDALADQLWRLTLSVANGETRAKNEINGCREIAIFKDGVTL